MTDDHTANRNAAIKAAREGMQAALDEWAKDKSHSAPERALAFAVQGACESTQDNHWGESSFQRCRQDIQEAIEAIGQYRELPPAEVEYVLNFRGEWTGGEAYYPLDYVTEPGKTDTLLCLQESTSSSNGVLRNKEFWVPITLPE